MIRAVLRMLLLMAAVSVVVFVATEALPGDAALIRTGGRATSAQLAEVRHESGVDRPIWRRYASWLGGLVRGDAGTSLITDRPVRGMVAERLPATLSLAGAALAVTVPLMTALGWAAARARPRVRRVVAAAVGAGAAVPQVVVAGALVAVFAGWLAWLPPVSLLPAGGSPLESVQLLVLPVLALAIPSAAYGAGLLRGAFVDTTARPHVADAVLRGVSPARLAVRHILPFVLAPALRVLAVVAGGLVASAAVVETMFGYAGLGELLVSAVATRDTPVVHAVAMLGATVVLAGMLLADLVAARTRPRGGGQT